MIEHALHLHVDARLLRAGGIGRYVRELTGRWLLRPDVSGMCFFGRREELEPFLAEHDERGVARIVSWRDRPYSPAAQVRWPGLTRACPERPDVTFFPHFDVPLIDHPTPSVVVVHDLIHFEVPHGFPAWKRVLGSALLRGALERATAVVTVSETSRHAICHLAPGMTNRIQIVRNGVGAAFRPAVPEELQAAQAEWGHVGPFLLCVGPAKAHKNLEHAVRVLAELPADEGWRLLLVGPTEADRDRLVGAAAPEVQSRVVVTSDVTDDQLRALYSMASAVLVPSLLEGFGLPVLEARACGAKVLAADLAWSRELMASGVSLMSGWDPAAWASEVRSSRSAPPPLAIEDWGWDTAARLTFDVLRRAAEVGATPAPL